MGQRIKNLREEGRNSYADMNTQTLGCIKAILGDINLKSISTLTVDKFIRGLSGLSNATKQIRLTHLRPA